MSRNKRAPQRRLGFESLESRLPLAGDVKLSLSNGNLSIKGDANINDIAIVQTDVGDFTISGHNGENFKMKGQADSHGPITLTGVNGTITAKMGGSSDFLT